MNPSIRRIGRTTTVAAAVLMTFMLLAACTPELASFDDNYVPQSVEENYPVRVVERPLSLQVEATVHGLQAADQSEVIGFARQATDHATTPVTIGYASGSKSGRLGAQQAAVLVTRQGVTRSSVVVTPHDGRDNVVTLKVGMKVAETKPCGDWSQNLRGNQFNDSGPNFGCAVQQNMAAMVANPQDFEHPRPMTPGQIVSQNGALDKYNSGAWTTPTVVPNGSLSQ